MGPRASPGPRSRSPVGARPRALVPASVLTRRLQAVAAPKTLPGPNCDRPTRAPRPVRRVVDVEHLRLKDPKQHRDVGDVVWGLSPHWRLPSGAPPPRRGPEDVAIGSTAGEVAGLESEAPPPTLEPEYLRPRAGLAVGSGVALPGTGGEEVRFGSGQAGVVGTQQVPGVEVHAARASHDEDRGGAHAWRARLVSRRIVPLPRRGVS